MLQFIYLFDSPRILHSVNGKEFTNSDLSKVVEDFKTKQIHGRPYHPQSQSRVERFNRTLTEYFRREMSLEKDWPSKLQEFYYNHNNRVHKSTRPSTPYQLAPPTESGKFFFVIH
jgi:transposase InsO family protein